METQTTRPKWLGWIAKLLLVLFVALGLLLLVLLLGRQHFEPNLESVKPFCQSPKELSALPPNIHVPPDLQQAVRSALAHFPDLQTAQITFRYASISATMQAQPVLNWSVFSREDRAYIIKVNDNQGAVKTLDFSKMPADVQEGWIGHELGHIWDYHQRSTFSVLGLGVNYLLSQRFHQQVEIFADRIAVFRGLGEESADGMEYVFSATELSPAYLKNLQENYLSAEELRSMMEEYWQACQLDAQ